MKKTQKRQGMMCGLRVSVLALAVLMAFSATSAWAAETSQPAPVMTPLEEAKALALQHARLTEGAVTLTKMGIDKDDGRLEYEIEFIADGIVYDYEIDATTKAVLNASSEKADKKWQDIEGGQYLTWAEAREKALAAAGVTAEQAAFTVIQFDFDDRRAEYEVEFTVDGKAYEVDLDAVTGEVLKQKTDREDDDWDDDDRYDESRYDDDRDDDDRYDDRDDDDRDDDDRDDDDHEDDDRDDDDHDDDRDDDD